MSTSKYSIAIVPDAITIEVIKELKLHLAKEIGWYSSKNALAHITIGEFEGNSSSLQHIHEQISSVCEVLKSFDISFEKLDSFTTTGTLYMKPNATSTNNIINVMRLFHQRLNLKGSVANPYLTIGRKLTLEQIDIGKQVLHFTPFHFTCSNISLRKFNPEITQYEVIHTYNFN
ncbi:2'-5' RNA ligase family protein [Neptunitalea lumnitzerae]|uniref:2'-5' RNA ligase n=1 Tax=Neptunitalea lumnitzerae TaxID=2965509 RepID=A0ABQ5MIT9_9FLAO|nr:2'-5' RNA ligase family protein [Neptunitalea sp. Y10]GLB49300.1 hypothetical protein Y10_16680 [Neptunitalea sp. Y10]